MVQHDNRVHRYNGQSVEVGDAKSENHGEMFREKRNPYLLDYEEECRRQVRSQQEAGRRRSPAGGREEVNRRSAAGYEQFTNRRTAAGYEQPANRRTMVGYEQPANRRSPSGYEQSPNRRSPSGYEQPANRRTPTGYEQSPNRRTMVGYAQSPNRRSTGGYTEASDRRSAGSNASNPASTARRSAKYRRRKRIFMQRMAISIWALCLVCLSVTLLVKNSRASAADRNQKENQNSVISSGDHEPPKQLDAQQPPILVQGIPAAEFAKHPEWTEDFLTPNEYSRPGDPLESVTNIFVHYTANPGTSAAQNRSYFERQKDEHLASVSAHFIVGYEGEIIQCVPLDEIAYAVKSRNFDSVSIECCHLEKDGSFTQETYDSLIALLKWLLEVYDLDSEDILRHYDCGGKKCPLYYTEHPDAWEELKNDVDKL